jgi:hypothetical protein
MCEMIANSETIKSLPINIVHPISHDELKEALPTAHAVVWIWPPDAPTCDEITWTGKNHPFLSLFAFLN